MSTTAISLMVISMIILWGGLILAVVHLMRADARVAASGHSRPHTLDEARDHTL